MLMHRPSLSIFYPQTSTKISHSTHAFMHPVLLLSLPEEHIT